MKYKLINKQTGEEHICDKVTIDGFDYYTEEGSVVKPIDFSKFQYQKGNGLFNGMNNMKPIGEVYEVIATNNPNIDIPKVVDEVEKLALEYEERFTNGEGNADVDFKAGYNKSQETHPFSDDDMIEFALHTWDTGMATKESLQIWKEQQVKIIYYG